MTIKYRFARPVYVERDDVELELIATGTYRNEPARVSGPPERCSPGDEDWEYELSLDGKPWSGKLSGAEEDALLMDVIDAAMDDFDEPDEDYFDDPDEDY